MRRVACRVAAPPLSALAAVRPKVTFFNGDAEAFKKEIGDGPTVVNFFTEWCGPCTAFAPKYTEMSDAEEHAGVKFLKVNVEENEELGGAFEIRSIPTFVGLRNGKVVGKPVEGASEAGIKGLLASLPKA